MRYTLVKIIIIFFVIIFVNLTRTCPTRLGYQLLQESKVSHKDLAKLNLKSALDFKSSAGTNV